MIKIIRIPATDTFSRTEDEINPDLNSLKAADKNSTLGGIPEIYEYLIKTSH
jgi:hypothetical protein